ncbi:LysM peptidoglycan-binding domain-containing protein [Nitratireductor thuwali]|uniref:LysM domain-containing protein n=1 Tax=Nitratireductor thuwali TaxID=2267699 RepID=A0ABY5MP31_9HYPH|nr:hypothetical protein NTH_03508 [Nitratireductor thuwali]
MATIPIKVLLFIFGAAAAGLGTAYFAGALDPWLGKEQPVHIAEQAAVEPPPAETGKSDRPEAGLTAGEEGAGDAVAEGGDEEVVVPVFDIVRAEPDGSLVVAGKAAPNAEVDILSGSSVLATTQAGPSGDFATVLDRALEPGDHNIVLRSTTGDDIAATSQQTAIVSVPSEQSGDVVALVQQPGEPSRLISVPEARTNAEAPAQDASGPATEQQQTAEEAPPEEKPSEATAQDEPEPAAPETDPEKDIAAAPAVDSPSAETGGQTPAERSEQASPERSDEALADSSDRASAEDATAPADGDMPASGDAPQVAEAEQTIRKEAEQPAEKAEAEPAGAGAEAGDAAAEPIAEAPPADSAPAAPAADGTPFIEAVEIDGRQIFVAGRAEPGRTVRIYVNDMLLGQTEATPTGRFLVETERDLPVGDYIVRADVLAEDGTVIARAAVPFQRESGDKIAAVAPPAAGAPSATGSDASGQASQETRQATAADTAQTGAPADSGEASAVAKSDAEPSGDAAGAAPRDTRSASAQTGEDAQGDAGGGNVVVAQKLEPVDGSVIIRRGDTLWHISRRVYGQGIRYTTIYLANQDQIRDPDLIWPGQVFALPEETDEGEKADLTAIGDRAAEPASGDTVTR